MISITMALLFQGQPESRKARFTCWTLNNYTKEEITTCVTYAQKCASYMCWSEEECPTTGTPHLQGYVHWTSARSLNKFKTAISPRLHYEPYTMGTAAQNRAYCQGMVEKKGMKVNPTFQEYGEIPKQGERTDWTLALEHLNTGTVADAVSQQPHLLPAIRALQTYKQMGLKGTHRDVEVIVLVGPPGCGKTRYAWDTYPDLYTKPDGPWFDGYANQDTILLDDYYGNLPYAQLLKMCDRYPLLLPVKGGFVAAAYSTIIITSNAKPKRWYPHPVDALMRRITEYRDYNITDAPQDEAQVSVPTCPPPRPDSP